MSQTIYAIINTTNNHFYIGRTEGSLEMRLCRHYRQRNSADRKHRPLFLAMQSLPRSAFEIIALEVVDDRDAKNAETKAIELFRASSPNEIYNIGNGDAFQGVRNPYAPINNISPAILEAVKVLHSTKQFDLKTIAIMAQLEYHLLCRYIRRQSSGQVGMQSFKA